ncbi:serine/threonine protein kinase VPS15, putative [Plasmodium knowlesi strain H]|uniref:Serine/threonine protein kinase VPS15, putative n=1 Tax=Plasmodium knowlesi (strain H) TaxID=5851 RepID=A0A1A7VXK0_PLAKH|nr:serine/threonine protein kinase VPS15, putative [Plasmodium knowlesi strain H]
MGNTLYSSTGCSSTQLDDMYAKYVNNLYNIYSYLFKYEHFVFMNCYALNSFCHVLEGINKNEGHVLIKVFKLRCETQKIKRILYTLKFLFSFDLFPNVLPYNRMSVYENNIYIYRTFVFKSLNHYLFNERNNKPFKHFFLFQIFLAIIQLHSLGIYHGHIKSENFLLQNNMHILITDINILNKYLYFIPSVRYPGKENSLLQRLQKLQDDIFNLGILLLEIILRDKNVSYAFLKENYDDKNDCNFQRERSRQGMFQFVESGKGAEKTNGKGKVNGKVKKTKRKEDKEFPFISNGSVESTDRIIDLSTKKINHNFVHALSLPFINRRIKNEEESFFQENKHVKMNIDKYRHYNYHYINSVNYINIYNDFYNNGTLNSVNENNSHRGSLTTYGGNVENEVPHRSKTVLYDRTDGAHSFGEAPHAFSDYEVLGGETKGGRRNRGSHDRLDLHVQRDWGSISSNEMKEPEVTQSPVSTVKVDGGNVDGGKVNGGKVNGRKVDGGKVDGGKVDGGKVDGGKVDEALHPRRRSRQADRREKGVPYKIWKIVNVAKHPFIVYSLINHFFLQKKNNILKIFKYWSYYVFPSTYKYVFFPLTILQLHPVFKNADIFILLLHYNLPFILFHLDLFAQKERDKYDMLNMVSRHNGEDSKSAYKIHQRSSFSRDGKSSSGNAQEKEETTFHLKRSHTLQQTRASSTRRHAGRLAHFVDVVKEFTTGVNKHQMETYIRDSDLGDIVKVQILQQWNVYRREIKGRRNGTSGVYHSTCHFPFPTLSYKNAHEFYRNFLVFYKTLFNEIFQKNQSYIDIFSGLEICKREIYSPLFRGTNIRRSNTNSCHSPNWTFNEDILHLVNMIITSYQSLAYESTKLLCLEMLYCIIFHFNHSTLNREVTSFLLFCMNKSGEKLKIMIIKSFYKIMNNENAYEHMYPYVEKFLPSFLLLKDSKEKIEKYFYAKYLPLIANVTIQYIYNVGLLKKGRKKQKEIAKEEEDGKKTGPDEVIISEVKHMDILKTLRNHLVHILKYSTDESILFEFYEHLISFCKIMSRKWVRIYILPYLLANIYKTKNSFIRALSIRITLRIMSYINDSETYKMICAYVNPILFEGNELAILFLLSECNILLQKNARKRWLSSGVPPSGHKNETIERTERGKKKQKTHTLLAETQINHLRNHPSVAIRDLAHTVQANLLKMST